jgi:hypothetical protein
MIARATLAVLLLAAVPAAAQNLPPTGALPLSQVLAGVEARDNVRVITEVEWDDDGYWDVEFVDTGNRSRSVRIDPMTGEDFSRRRR